MKKAVIAILVLGIVGAGGYGAYYYFYERPNAEERVSSDSEDAVYVDQISVITGYGSGNGYVNRFGGEVEPQETLKVKLENDRKVKECYVKEGDEVKEGQRLFMYDTTEDEDKIAEAEIEIEKAEGEIEVAKKSIEEAEKSRAKASADEQLDYTMMILTQQNTIKQQEYEIKTKKREIEQLKDGLKNATVTAEMGGLVQKIQDPNSTESSGYYYGGSEDGTVYITILSAGDYRVKGSLNEQNMDAVYEGMPVLIHSRIDETVTWSGMVSEVKLDNAEEDNQNMWYSSGAESSSYAFYVELDDSEGLLLGQHVYIEEDSGTDDKKDGLWLEEYYLMQEDDGKAYVWRANEKDRLEKHEVTLGEYDENLMKYEITAGLEAEDYIAMPMETIVEGAPVIYNDYSQNGGMGGMNGMGGMDDMSGMDGMGGMDDMSSMDGGELGMGGEDAGSDDGEVPFFDADAAEGGLTDLDALDGEDGEEPVFDADAEGDWEE